MRVRIEDVSKHKTKIIHARTVRRLVPLCRLWRRGAHDGKKKKKTAKRRRKFRWERSHIWVNVHNDTHAQVVQYTYRWWEEKRGKHQARKKEVQVDTAPKYRDRQEYWQPDTKHTHMVFRKQVCRSRNKHEDIDHDQRQERPWVHEAWERKNNQKETNVNQWHKGQKR